jgi:hypothetical protein
MNDPSQNGEKMIFSKPTTFVEWLVYGLAAAFVVLMSVALIGSATNPPPPVTGIIERVESQEYSLMNPKSTFIKLKGIDEAYQCTYNTDPKCAIIVPGDNVTLHMGGLVYPVNSITINN